MTNIRSFAIGLCSAAFLAGPLAWAADGGSRSVVIAQNQTTAPADGANSFTEGQAKSRIENAGYSSVSALKKDDKGVWRGTATKNGQQGSVGLDYKGDVVTQ